MSVSKEALKRTRDLLSSKKIMVTEELTSHMGASLRTAQRQLAQWSCLRSYSNNARYVALPENAWFDEHGIWVFEDVCFSKFGNLIKTVSGVVEESPHGLTSRELSRRVHLNSRSFLSQFVRRGILRSEKVGPRAHYFSADPCRFNIQREGLKTVIGESSSVLSDAATVQMLLEWIRNPDVEPSTLANTLAERHYAVTTSSVANFLGEHGLLKKK